MATEVLGKKTLPTVPQAEIHSYTVPQKLIFFKSFFFLNEDWRSSPGLSLVTELVKDPVFSGSGFRIRIQSEIRISDPDPDPGSL